MQHQLFALSVTVNVIFLAGIACAWWCRRHLIRRFVAGRSARMRSLHQMLNNTRADVVFFGDSLTEGGYWQEWFRELNIANRGIGGDTTENLVARADTVIALQPRKLFVMIGVNDISLGIPLQSSEAQLIQLLDSFEVSLPNTRFYVQSVLPTNSQWPLTSNSAIVRWNDALKAQCHARGYTYIDLHPLFTDSQGQLQSSLSNDGLHLMARGYQLWRNAIEPYVTE